MTNASVGAMVSRKVHVNTGGPKGWNGYVRSCAGTTLTVATPAGIRRLVDMSRVTVRVIQ